MWQKWLIVMVLFLAVATVATAAGGVRAHWERVPVKGGSELLVLFSVLPGGSPDQADQEVPILGVLRDTLDDDDPDNDRLRYVWLLMDETQGRLARWLTSEPRFGDVPRPVVDLTAPGNGVWKTALRAVVQAMILDSRGVSMRVPSRSYWSNHNASRTVRLFEALCVMLRLQEQAGRGPLDPDEYSRVLARVLLAERPLGGLVRDQSLRLVLEQDLRNRRQALGRNWELLRQRAEAEGLAFQPLQAGGEQPVAALIWIAREDLIQFRRTSFRSKFLGIANPWTDRALRQWTGYSEIWHFDAEGRRTPRADQAVRTQEMIPLSLYSLDHPKAPFLLVDFRSSWKPAFREAARRVIEEVPRTVLGIAPMTHLEAWGAQLAVSSIRGRQGAATHRPSRLRAAASARQVIFVSPQMQPALREIVAQRLGAAEPSSTRRYEALLAASRSQNGLERRIRQDRGGELAGLLHPHRARWLKLATVATGGLYRYRLHPTPERLALLDRERRVGNAVRAVEAALAASPSLDQGMDLPRIRWAVRELATVPSVKSSIRRRADDLRGRLTQLAVSDEVRRELLVLMDSAGSPAAGFTGGAAGGTD
jgi:hypothetical protein